MPRQKIQKIVFLSFLLILGLLALSCGTTSVPGGGSERFSFTDLGRVIGSDLMGVASGTSIADTSSVLLSDGSVRKYIYVGGVGLKSVTASVAGVSFNVEAGVRLAEGNISHQKVVTLNTGELRLYTGLDSLGGISSYLSSDGLTFALESGVRIATSDTGFSMLSHLSVVQLADGTYRGYFSDLPQPGGSMSHYIKSATSNNLLTWTVESGYRVELGEQPCAFKNSDGSVSLFYYKAGSSAPRLYYATASDGLTFTDETQTTINGNGPDILQLQDGSYMLYYDTSGSDGEFYVGAARMTIN